MRIIYQETEETLHKLFTSYLEICTRHLRKPAQKSIEGILQVNFSEKIFMQSKVDELEVSKEFKALVKESMTRYAGKYPKEPEWGFKDAIKNFFRQSGCYIDIYDEHFDIENRFESFTKSFEEKAVSTSYLALMEGVVFTRKINGRERTNKVLDCGHFQIKRFSKEELDSLTNNRIRSLFYPYAVIDTERLCDYWFICKDETIPIESFTLLDIDPSGFNVKREFSPFPPVIESLLCEIVLFEWEESPPNNFDEFFNSFSIPIVLQIRNNPMIAPLSLPDYRLALQPTLDNTGNKVGEEAVVWIEMEENISARFIAFIKSIHELLYVIDKANKENKGNYNFLERALGYLTKAFTSKPNLEQLIWHIVVLDALLGQKYKTRKPIATSLEKMFGKKEKDNFHKLYDIRCDYLHGDEIEKDIFLTHLREARILARKTINWFLKLLEIVLPKHPLNRDEIRSSINNDQKTLKKLTSLIDLPQNFPILE